MRAETENPRQPLEERITYCEHLVDAVNGVVTDLQKRVLSLELQNRKLMAELQQQREAFRVSGMDAERPPHY